MIYPLLVAFWLTQKVGEQDGHLMGQTQIPSCWRYFFCNLYAGRVSQFPSAQFGHIPPPWGWVGSQSGRECWDFPMSVQSQWTLLVGGLQSQRRGLCWESQELWSSGLACLESQGLLSSEGFQKLLWLSWLVSLKNLSHDSHLYRFGTLCSVVIFLVRSPTITFLVVRVHAFCIARLGAG